MQSRLWDLVYQTREYLQSAASDGSKTAEQLAGARRELAIAEGSDWFWWFGDSHHSAQQDLFDRLFRKHLMNVYTLLGDVPPTDLLQSIRMARGQTRLYTNPSSLLDVKVDGRLTYFEWLNAGHYSPAHGRGAMSVGTATRTENFYFGFDNERLFLRVDARGGPLRDQFSDIDSIRITFLQPDRYELLIMHPSRPSPIAQMYHHDVPVSRSAVQVASDVVLEIAVPWRSLAVAQGDQVHLYLELVQKEQAIERIPHEGAIETAVPSPDYELVMWQV